MPAARGERRVVERGGQRAHRRRADAVVQRLAAADPGSEIVHGVAPSSEAVAHAELDAGRRAAAGQAARAAGTDEGRGAGVVDARERAVQRAALATGCARSPGRAGARRWRRSPWRRRGRPGRRGCHDSLTSPAPTGTQAPSSRLVCSAWFCSKRRQAADTRTTPKLAVAADARVSLNLPAAVRSFSLRVCGGRHAPGAAGVAQAHADHLVLAVGRRCRLRRRPPSRRPRCRPSPPGISHCTALLDAHRGVGAAAEGGADRPVRRGATTRLLEPATPT